MPVIGLPETLKNKSIKKIDAETSEEIARESLGLGKNSSDEEIASTLDSLGIHLDDTLLGIGSLARNSKVDSVKLSAQRTLLELRGLVGKNQGSPVNNGIFVVVSDKEKPTEEYEKIFYPKEVHGRSIDISKGSNRTE